LVCFVFHFRSDKNLDHEPAMPNKPTPSGNTTSGVPSFRVINKSSSTYQEKRPLSATSSHYGSVSNLNQSSSSKLVHLPSSICASATADCINKPNTLAKPPNSRVTGPTFSSDSFKTPANQMIKMNANAADFSVRSNLSSNSNGNRYSSTINSPASCLFIFYCYIWFIFYEIFRIFIEFKIFQIEIEKVHFCV
jgi:hypothetical protein